MNLSRFAASLAAGTALLTAGPAVLAGGAEIIKTEVTALSGTNSVTVAADDQNSPLPFAVGYKLKVSNIGGSTATNIKLVIDALPAGTDAATLIKPAYCTLAGLRLQCTLGKLGAKQTFPEFYLYWNVQLNTLPTAGQKVTLQGTTYYAEGNNKNAIPTNSSYTWPVAGDTSTQIQLTTVNTSGAFAIVPPVAGGPGNVTLFTSADDAFHTQVTVPKSDGDAALASIEKEAVFTTGCANFVACFQTDLNIKLVNGGSVFSSPLEISLTHRSDNLQSGFQPKKVVVTYWKDGLVPGVDLGYTVGPCARDAEGNPVLPSDRNVGEPCLAEVVYSKGSDAVFKLLNDTNGSYRLP
jgi:uncharacterized repeat protein (TIGR01451 family)